MSLMRGILVQAWDDIDDECFVELKFVIVRDLVAKHQEACCVSGLLHWQFLAALV